jgi:Pyruvate/2-oxoacid:ferredoxin oxidoreductase delta subunit
MCSVELREDLCLSYKAKGLREQQNLLVQLGRKPTEVEAGAERRGPCGECFMFCPLRNRAIKLEPGAFLAPLVFTEHCVGCGMCEEICRTVVRGEPAIRVVRTRRRHGMGSAA